jgi:uncharacterized Zn finger protein
MVHYDPNARNAAQGVPPLCPKCGSHRTEVVGRSEDLKTVTLRCNACGERSQMPVDKDGDQETAA